MEVIELSHIFSWGLLKKCNKWWNKETLTYESIFAKAEIEVTKALFKGPSVFYFIHLTRQANIKNVILQKLNI